MSRPRPSARATVVAAAATLMLVVTVGFASPAAACGGLVGENGSIQLVRTTTLAAWHDGIERYVTSFEFSGTGEAVGSIIPLPAVPTSVESAGEWTLQRLQREVAPVLRSVAGAASSTSEDQAKVLLTTKVDALDITVLQGGGDEVGTWALQNGFFLTPDAPEVLDFYAKRSQIFLAAKFDAARAAAQGLNGGDGTPIMITMPMAQPWVPLRILGLGLSPDQRVQADVFLLTDDQPSLLSGDGIQVERSQPASTGLMTDLRADRNMDWMPASMWLSHLVLDDAAGRLDYDLSASAAHRSASPLAAGFPSADLQPIDVAGDGWGAETYAAIVGTILAAATLIALFVRTRRLAA